MSLNINSESTNLRRSEEKRYAQIIIETTFREDKGVIDLRNPTGGTVQAKNTTQSQTIASNSQATADSTKKQNKNISIRNSINSSASMKIMRGQKVSINSQTQDLSKLILALDWDVSARGNTSLELDTSLFMVDANGKTAEEDFIFYGNPKSRDSAVVISGDYNSGLKVAYDESIELNLNVLNRNVEKLAITVTVFEGEKRNQNFSQLSNAYIRIIDAQTKKELFNYRFDEGLRFETAVVVAEIYRYKNEWKINPIGNGFTGGLEALCNNYGIKTE